MIHKSKQNAPKKENYKAVSPHRNRIRPSAPRKHPWRIRGGLGPKRHKSGPSQYQHGSLRWQPRRVPQATIPNIQRRQPHPRRSNSQQTVPETKCEMQRKDRLRLLEIRQPCQTTLPNTTEKTEQYNTLTGFLRVWTPSLLQTIDAIAATEQRHRNAILNKCAEGKRPIKSFQRSLEQPRRTFPEFLLDWVSNHFSVSFRIENTPVFFEFRFDFWIVSRIPFWTTQLAHGSRREDGAFKPISPQYLSANLYFVSVLKVNS